ncbi:hypothetical protein ASPZODRAFT_1468304 [Penicilliopsis zonata CBS 506.65]|uniref:Complex 1 LYR protein domain-containing protein n=1 Tax=Penicilliopsis zonata CBS 506.65 TaxID=1073090 RepID=A0A1L9SQM2_9EURO|nr:hypothetical protein ASPZODRAFT_1468304 [Penicilliopsis zonata CBS 506.65]OJJ49384.1 hypothetical protein ASPZODRAFT_1468304 [Penicilliopsis zonata CBS 506.65]
MHRLVVPKLSSVHRFACLALYRALLRQAGKVNQGAPALQAIKPTIQQNFKRYKKLQSPTQTANALRAGYEALDMLHAASQGHERSINTVSQLIAESQDIKERNRQRQRQLSKFSRPKPLSRIELKRMESRRFQQKTAARHPDATPILSRPRPVVTGKRRIPVLVTARGVPFLRIKKPQPRFLSEIIKAKLKKRWGLIERRDRLQNELLFAQEEDEWDQLTNQSDDSVTWDLALTTCIQETDDSLTSLDEKNLQLAEEMWKVVLAERELAAMGESSTHSPGFHILPDVFLDVPASKYIWTAPPFSGISNDLRETESG